MIDLSIGTPEASIKLLLYKIYLPISCLKYVDISINYEFDNPLLIHLDKNKD